jgi:capsular polysaccharide export protein
MGAGPLLAIPPFPGARVPAFAVPARCGAVGDVSALLAAMAAGRVGGCYWGVQSALPDVGFLLDGTASPAIGSLAWPRGADPWHMLAGAQAVRLPPGDPRILLALAADRPVRVSGNERPPDEVMINALVVEYLVGWQWRDPFSGEVIGVEAAIELAGFWRRLIDANRGIAAALGFAYWKKPTVAPLLWAGQPVNFTGQVPALAPGQKVAVWQSRLAANLARDIADRRPPVMEVEDGFIRSAGLGADCVPPLSVIVDGRGIHFDPTRPSGLEELLQNGNFPQELVARAASLRAVIVAGGLSKYERGQATPLPRPGGARRHVLVPGQVEDDRAVTSGGALSSNIELLCRARAEAGPDAFVIYKPHPDVLAGHRRGLIKGDDMAALADRVDSGAPMGSLITMVDELHVNSSLAGFEALLRGKPVTVHGVPFYAGWGLTTDRGAVPDRRTARRTLDELVAAALLLYPRYLDPETGLPCPAEVLVRRLTAQTIPRLAVAAAAVVGTRRFLGRTRSRLVKLLG